MWRSWRSLSIDISTYIHQSILEAFGRNDTIIASAEPEKIPQRLGVAGPALHYANIINQIDNIINEEASDKVLEVEQKYSEFLSHPTIGELLSEEDQKIFRHLNSLEVEDFKDVKLGYAITFNFHPNPYFEDTKLTKTFTFLDDKGSIKITATSIKWKEGLGLPNGVNHEKKGNKRPFVDESLKLQFSLMVATRRSQVSSEHQKCDKIFDGLVKLLKTQQEQLKTLATERKFLRDRIKMQHEKWVSDVHLYEDQISQMKSSTEAQEMMRFLEAAKSDMVVGLKHREASFLKLKLENIGDKLADFRAWFDILRYNPTIWLVAQSQLVQRWSKGK